MIDERDQRELDDREGEQSGEEPPLATVERVKVTRKVNWPLPQLASFLMMCMAQVLLRTVDNFQGEEAKVKKTKSSIVSSSETWCRL